MFRRRVECRTRHQPVQPRQHDLQLLEQAFSLRRRLIALRSPHQQIVVKRIPHPLQGATHSGLAQQQPLGGTRYIPLLGKHREDNKEVQVGLT